MAIIKCKMCGGDIALNEDRSTGVCEYCGSLMTFPKVSDEQRLNLFNRANHLRRLNDYDKALTAYEKILDVDDTDAEAHWGAVLSRYGIEYVEDPVTHERIPTCHRVQPTSILTDPDYEAAIKFSPDGEARALYEKEARRIAEIQKGILAISAQEKPYDVFICYKESDDSGSRTVDSMLAQEIYYQLTGDGYKVFFSRITLEDKLGQQYEPYIFAALNSAKVMLVVGTKPEHFGAVWVKNEWSRYLDLMRGDHSRLLIPCYRDMDPYDLPEELAGLQSQDMSKIGFMQDLIRGVKKVLGGERGNVSAQPTAPGVASLYKRAQLFLEDGDWDSAGEYLDHILDIDPEFAPAYIGKVQVSRKVKKEDGLARCAQPLKDDPNYQKALRFADETRKAVYEGYDRAIVERLDREKKEAIYREAEALEKRAAVEKDFLAAAQRFEAAGEIRDAKTRAADCRAKAAAAKAEADRQAEVYRRQAEAERRERERREAEEKAERARREAEEQEKRKREAEERQRQEEERQREEAARRARNRRVGAVVAALLVLALAGYLIFNNVIRPRQAYNDAQALLDAGKYTEAEAAFAALDGYGDSADKIHEINYRRGRDALAAGNDTSAREWFLSAGDYSDAQAQIQRIDEYALAAVDLRNGDVFSARQRYAALGDYRDAPERLESLNSEVYALAGQRMAEGDFAAADQYYHAIAGYADTDDIIANYDAALQNAQDLWDSGDKAGAEGAFSAFTGWGDSAQRLEALREEIADDALAAEDYDLAVTYYGLLKNPSEDVRSKAAQAQKGSDYRKAKAAFEAGDLDSAHALFVSAGDHADAAARAETLSTYLAACEDLTNAAYIPAREAFMALGDYLDAADKLELCNAALYKAAEGAMASGDVAAAHDTFALISGYSDSADRAAAIEEDYESAGALLARGDYDGAIAAFEALSNYSGSAAQVSEARYLKAGALADAGEYAQAAQIYHAIEDYRDSVDRALQADYSGALALEDAGDLQAAAEGYKALGEYQDAPQRLVAVSTRIADAAMESGEYAEALTAYLRLEQTDDVRSKEYELAQRCYEEGHYAEATAAYEALGQYQLSLSKLPIARYAWADQLFSAGSYAEAAAQFEMLGDMTDSAARRQESLYQLAASKLAAKEYDAAKALFLFLPGYSDAGEQVKECDYQKAVSLMKTGDYAAAQVLFETIPDHSDSKALRDQCVYQQAEALYTAGEYQAAHDLYFSINYSDSWEKANQCVYNLAQAAYEGGDYAGAEVGFTSISGYLDSAERVKDCRLMQGRTLYEGGQYREALDYLEGSDYGDSTSLAAQCHRALGEAAIVSGDMDGAVYEYAHAAQLPEVRSALMDIGTDYAAINEAEKAVQALWLIREDESAAALLGEIGALKAQTGETGQALLAYCAVGDADSDGMKTLATPDNQSYLEQALSACALLPDELRFADDLRYTYAGALNEAGEFEAAYAIYARITGYKDVDSIIENDDNISAAAAAREAYLAQFEVGKTVTFGHYEQDNNTSNGQEAIEWIVLAREGDQVLLLSKYGLDAKPYNKDYVAITWETCSLRAWLNDAFLNTAFTADEQGQILLTNVDNSKSQGYSGYSTNGGNNTQDKIFLLSYNEAWTYFSSDDARKCAPTDYAVARGAYTSSSNKVDGQAAGWWWLRSPGSYQDDAAGVSRDGSRGSYDVNRGSSVARPAFWLNLESGII